MARYVSYELGGCRCLVTGAASGIGFGTASMLARSGAAVAINYLPDDPRGREAVKKLTNEGLNVIGAPGRVGARGETEKMVEKAIADLGGLDLLVNNAATPVVRKTIPIERLDLVTDELWTQILETNLIGVFRCTIAAAPALKSSRGSVVNTASITALGSYGTSIPYTASKAGVVNLTRNLARALAPEVRVNAIAPGSVDSTWIDWTSEQLERALERTLLKRVGTPSDYADVILFLAFGNETITGELVVVDAGKTLC
jgi:3-oxoacyl-[acyl-carrier protein] reductase